MKFYIIVPIIFIIFFSCKEKKTSLINFNKNHGEILYNKGEKLFNEGKYDSAYIYFFRSKIFYLENKDSINISKSSTYLGIIQLSQGDYFGANESFISSLKYLNETRNKENFTSILNSIAISNKNLKNYNSSIFWYHKALKLSQDSLEKIIIRNNISVVNIKNKNYKTAIREFKSLLKNKDLNQNLIYKSKILDNLAYAKFLQNKHYNAEPELYYALEIREKQNDFWGQNASHAHLSDYFAGKNIQKALFHAKRMYQVAKSLKSPDDQLEALQKLISLDKPEKIKNYFKTYQNLNDSLQTARNKAKNQFALIRYETEKNRADLLKMEAENSQKNYEILKHRMVIFSGLFLTLVSTFIAINWYKKRKQKLENKRLIDIKNTELKYSKKVHDVVANGIYHVMTEVENNKFLNHSVIVDRLENLYEKSRDISNIDIQVIGTDDRYDEKLIKLFNEYNSEQTNILTIGVKDIRWNKISENIKNELFLVLQELFVNMRKHSKASIVNVKFEKKKQLLLISYFDNGIGISTENLTKKNGLKNAENRIYSCNGSFIFDENIRKGIKIIISIPI